MSSAPTTPIVVATTQAAPVPADVVANARLGALLIGESARRGARVVVLPELFLCAYHPPSLSTLDVSVTHVTADDDRRVADTRLEPLVAAAMSTATVVIMGAAVHHSDGRRTCSALLIDSAGSVTAAYDKQNLCGPDERALFTAGSRAATVTVDGWRLALGICYDGCFPEHGRAAALDGAHAYLCPAGFVAGSQHRRDLYYAARALDNTMYVVFANSVDGVAPWTFNGGAAVYDPEGRPLVKAPDQGQRVLTATLDPMELARVRDALPMLRERPSGPAAGRWQLSATAR